MAKILFLYAVCPVLPVHKCQAHYQLNIALKVEVVNTDFSRKEMLATATTLIILEQDTHQDLQAH